MDQLKLAAESVGRAIQEAGRGLIEREVLAELIVLAAVAREHLLVIGPPGTAKSAVVRRVAQTLGGVYFEYLLGRFTEPTEIFGPVDLRKLREGTVETETREMLPEAEVAFLDEVFLGSTAILNTLLAVLNERTFRRGHTRLACPLRVCVGASNALPDDESLAAFADRFLVRVFVDPVPDSRLEDLLEGGRSISDAPLRSLSSMEHLDTLTTVARNADLTAIRPAIAHAVRLLRKAGISLYDRRIVKAQALVSAAAALAGRAAPDASDLWPIIYLVPTLEQQKLARDVLGELFATASNPVLPSAAEDASSSLMARANRLAQRGRELLAASPTDDADRSGWMLHLEAMGREIDAGFTDETLTADLKSLRDQIIAALGAAV